MRGVHRLRRQERVCNGRCARSQPGDDAGRHDRLLRSLCRCNAESGVLAHPTEHSAFEAQLRAMGAGSTYLVDTFDVEQGIRNAVDVVGLEIGGVRIDTGDLLDDSRRARKLLDDLGAVNCRIVGMQSPFVDAF